MKFPSKVQGKQAVSVSFPTWEGIGLRCQGSHVRNGRTRIAADSGLGSEQAREIPRMGGYCRGASACVVLLAPWASSNATSTDRGHPIWYPETTCQPSRLQGHTDEHVGHRSVDHSGVVDVPVGR
jgi:hypothetical protein